ncbi:hypothetical protein GGP41_009970 [Bipolaris sorokiniana]|uniref:Uncharacterized protein n=1 Tax=Cochliobolus sativus TaxID=45130 RepID=A0A8H5ZGR3_COCSA|nr:hypothetical protein GGP41_009970 [Bipolaris sorokiniana]
MRFPGSLRKWATICRLCPQPLRGLVTKRKSLRSIFSVRRCTSSAPSLLLSCSTFLVGAGMYLCIVRPFLSSLHALNQALSASVLNHFMSVILTRYSCEGCVQCR